MHCRFADININILRDGIEMPFGAVFADYEIFRYHYDAIAKDVKLGADANAVSWELYQRVLRVLRIIAKALNLAVEASIGEVSLGREFYRIVVIERSNLVRVLGESLDLDNTQASLALRSVVFSPILKNIEIWDTPLIEIDKEKILFIPALVEMGSSSRAMENIVAQWNSDLFAKRGKVLENSLEEFLREQQISAQGPIIFSSTGNQKIECDLVAYWEGFLILIEAKCTKDIFSPAEFFRAKEHIEDAINQLNFRKQQILLNWKDFKLAASQINFPELPVSAEKIKLIAVTNVLHFTGWKNNGAVVTDEFCFQRFFGDAEVEGIMASNEGHKVVGTVGRIRKHIRPTANEFFTYLENPPQVKIIKDCLTLESIPIPIINDTDPKIGMVYTTYHPEKHHARIAAKKLLGRKPKKRKRHHKK